MKKFNPFRHGLAVALFGLTAAACIAPSASFAEDTPAAAKADVLRPEILKALQAAKASFEAKNTADAFAKLAETDAITDKTPYETFAVERTRADYYTSTGDKVKAAKAWEAVLATNYLQKKSDQLTLSLAIGQSYFLSSDYPTTIKWMTRYLNEGGTDAHAKDMLNKSYFLNKQYAEAFAGINQYVQAELAAGRVPEQLYFQMLLNSKNALNDDAGTDQALVQLVTYYPAARQWEYLVSRIHGQPGFNDHLFLDIFRLKMELGLMKSAVEYSDMAELAIRAGLPAEAKKALDQGFAAGLMDKGPEAKKYNAQLVNATKLALEDQKTMQQGEAGADKAKDGAPLVNLGMAFVTAGQYEKGASLIEKGLAKGLTARADEARLHLGLAYYWGGRKEDAIKQLQTVQTNDGSSTIARYWIMQINRPLAK